MAKPCIFLNLQTCRKHVLRQKRSVGNTSVAPYGSYSLVELSSAIHPDCQHILASFSLIKTPLCDQVYSIWVINAQTGWLCTVYRHSPLVEMPGLRCPVVYSHNETLAGVTLIISGDLFGNQKKHIKRV